MCHELQHHPAATNMARLSRALHQCAVLPPWRKSRELVLDWLAAVQATAPRRQLPIRSSWPSRWSNAPRPRACPRSRATCTSLSASVPVQWRGRVRTLGTMAGRTVPLSDVYKTEPKWHKNRVDETLVDGRCDVHQVRWAGGSGRLVCQRAEARAAAWCTPLTPCVVYPQLSDEPELCAAVAFRRMPHGFAGSSSGDGSK